MRKGKEMGIEFTEKHLTMLTQVDERGKSNQHRLDEAEADIKELQEKNNALYEMNANIRTLSEGILSVKTDVQEIRVEQGEMKSDITDLKNAPHKSKAKAFDTVWKFIVTAVGGAFVGWVITTLLPQLAG